MISIYGCSTKRRKSFKTEREARVFEAAIVAKSVSGDVVDPRAGADLRLLQKTMGHASITVTAHIYADLYDDELDDVASALDALDDRPIHER
jgi:integrase